jgi:hypothetical protein
MRMVRTWWGDLGGLLAACVLTLLVVAPTMNACLCAESAPVSGAAVQAMQNQEHRDSAPCDAACCLSGHCHHGGSMLDTFVAAIPKPLQIEAEHLSANVRALASLSPSGPDRPPRA